MSRKALKEINQTSNQSEMHKQTRSGLKRELEIEENPCKRLKVTLSNVYPETLKDDQTYGDFMDNLTTVLGMHYNNIEARLNTTLSNNCLYNITKCIDEHSTKGKSSKILHELDEFREQNLFGYINDDNTGLFCDFLSGIVMSGEFPYENIIQYMLEIMLSINETKSGNYDDFIDSAETLFLQILEKFPPCWIKVRESYSKVLTNKLKMNNFNDKKYIEHENGIFTLLLSLLEYNTKNDGDCEKSNTVDETEFNYSKWEAYHKQTYNFEEIPREERLERIFRVLHLLVQLLEDDLAVWMLKHPINIIANLKKKGKAPLIMSLFWNEHDGKNISQVNRKVKQVMKLFIDIVHLNYPPHNVQVLSRLLNLIGTIFNLQDISITLKNGQKLIKFPVIGEHSKSFVKEFKCYIDEYPHFSMSLCVNLLQNLQTPFIKLLLCEMLEKDLNVSIKSSNNLILQLTNSLKNHEWKNMTACNKSVDTSDPADDKEETIYPKLATKPSRKKSVIIFQNDFLFIQQTHLKSYMEFYRIHDLYNAAKYNSLISNIQQKPKSNTIDSDFNIEMLNDLASHKFCHTDKITDQSLFKKADLAKQIFKGIDLNKDQVINCRSEVKVAYYLQQGLGKSLHKYEELKEMATYVNAVLKK